VPDIRRSFRSLNEEWETCRKCELGERRDANGGLFVAGEGTPRGVLFVGEGPGKEEEATGTPFIGPSGRLLREIIENLGLENYFISNLVACRSCAPATNADGTPRFFNRKYGPPLQIFRDEPPLPMHIASCAPRFYEELYLVDPVIVVALGVKASETLLKRPVAILKERGQLSHFDIPGAWHKPILTEKRGAWVRKVKGEVIMPTEQNQVQYLVMPTLHPAFVLRKWRDRHEDDSPIMRLVGDIRLAVKIYERYMLEAFHVEPSGRSDTPAQTIIEHENDEETEEETM
jgi:uracil-DNA glycosylase